MCQIALAGATAPTRATGNDRFRPEHTTARPDLQVDPESLLLRDHRRGRRRLGRRPPTIEELDLQGRGDRK
jgi:hypothetical protein